MSNSPINHSEDRQIGAIAVKASLGNIVHAEADALVVPQFLNCASEGGVGYAIMAAGAEHGVVDEYNAEHQRRGSFKFGDAFATPSHGGPTRSLVHVISVGSGREHEFSTINRAVYNALVAADQAGLSRVAFPMLCTGIIGNLDDRQSAQAMLTAVMDYAGRNPNSSIKSVDLVVYGDPRSHGRNPAYQALRGTLFDDSLPHAAAEVGRREFDAERWVREMGATVRRPEDRSLIQQLAERLGFGKKRLDS
jgi:O-acetyl-ADP-ribose deacetylase (regulator of RNase III)